MFMLVKLLLTNNKFKMKKLLLSLFVAISLVSCNEVPKRNIAIKVVKAHFPKCKVYNFPDYNFKFIVVDSVGNVKIVDCLDLNSDSISNIVDATESYITVK